MLRYNVTKARNVKDLQNTFGLSTGFLKRISWISFKMSLGSITFLETFLYNLISSLAQTFVSDGNHFPYENGTGDEFKNNFTWKKLPTVIVSVICEILDVTFFFI